MEDYEILCGKTFLTLKGNFTFVCTLCEEKIFNFQDFFDHVTSEHYAIKDEEEGMDSIDSFDNEYENQAFQTEPDTESQMEEEGMDSIDSFDNEDENQAFLTEQDTESQMDSVSLVKSELEFVAVEDSIKKFKESRKKENITISNPSTTSSNNNANQETCNQSICSNDSNIPKKRYKCTECPYSSEVKLQLHDHMRRHFGDRPFQCTECSQRFYRVGELKRHTRKYHNPEMNEPERTRVTDIPRMTTNEDGNFQCTMCKYSSNIKTAMWSHVRRHSNWRPHQCQYCSKSFLTSTELRSHTRTHTGEKPYLCVECGCTFSTSGKLSMHKKKHANIRDKECPVCKMKFFNSNQLKSHLTVHSQERPHPCSYCEASFKQRKALRNHVKIHENKLEYECEFCSARFNQRPGLISHVKTKHSVGRKSKEESIE